MMSNTGSNFYSRFGDRLPTREVKSRRGQGVFTAKGNTRGISLGNCKNVDQNTIKLSVFEQ